MCSTAPSACWHSPNSPGTFNTVMPDMEGGTWVKDVVRIEVLPLPIAVEPELLVTGNVKESLGLRDEDLQAMEVTKISATHPKKGTTDDYEGVLVNALLEKAGVQEGATAINIVASDGYAIEVPLADVTGCAECLLAFTDETGVYNTVMPDLEGGTWVKDVVKIEVLPLPVADLSIFGLVDNPQAFSEADLRAMEVSTISATHPKKGTTADYEGVLLTRCWRKLACRMAPTPWCSPPGMATRSRWRWQKRSNVRSASWLSPKRLGSCIWSCLTWMAASGSRTSPRLKSSDELCARRERGARPGFICHEPLPDHSCMPGNSAAVCLQLGCIHYTN